MSAADFLALLPQIAIAATAILVMVGIAIRRSHAAAAVLTIAGLMAAFISIAASMPLAPRQVTSLLMVDRYALFYLGLIILSAAAVALISFLYFRRREGDHEELYILLLLATLGCAVLVESSHFISFLLGLEILSVSLYAMVAYSKDRRQALEAGMKYLVLASASAAFLLFGMALIYCSTGTMEFARLRELPAADSSSALFLAGIVLTVTGIGFKLGVVPFHLWTPDVYEGAPPPVAAFVATTSKTATVALLLRYFYLSGALQHRSIFVVFTVIAIASMAAGNLLALRQRNVKRILAYSSIAHFGYILVGFLAGGGMAIEAVGYYLTGYTITILAAFGIVALVSDPEIDADDLEFYRGLFWRRPVVAGCFTAALLSLAGIPATMGFLGKFYVLAAGAGAASWPLMMILALTSVIGLFYYLRIVVTLYELPSQQPLPLATASTGGMVVVGGLIALVILFGVYPAPLLNLIRSTMAGFI